MNGSTHLCADAPTTLMHLIQPTDALALTANRPQETSCGDGGLAARYKHTLHPRSTQRKRDALHRLSKLIEQPMLALSTRPCELRVTQPQPTHPSHALCADAPAVTLGAPGSSQLSQASSCQAVDFACQAPAAVSVASRQHLLSTPTAAANRAAST